MSSCRKPPRLCCPPVAPDVGMPVQPVSRKNVEELDAGPIDRHLRPGRFKGRHALHPRTSPKQVSSFYSIIIPPTIAQHATIIPTRRGPRRRPVAPFWRPADGRGSVLDSTGVGFTATYDVEVTMMTSPLLSVDVMVDRTALEEGAGAVVGVVVVLRVSKPVLASASPALPPVNQE